MTILIAQVDAQYAGNYSGTFDGDSDGVWSFSIDPSGNLSGRSVDSFGEVVSGTGTVSSAGNFAMIAASGNGITFSGQIDAFGNVDGTWVDSYWNATGAVTGGRLSPDVSQYAGEYSGTITGDASGTWTATVDNAGNWSGAGEVDFATYAINGILSPSGQLTAFIEYGGQFYGQIDQSGHVSGTWTDYSVSGEFTGNRISASGPEIVIEQPAGFNVLDGGTLNFNAVALGVSSQLSFIIKNIGSEPLSGLSVSKDGNYSSDFTVTALGSTALPPGTNTTFTVTFTPGAIGTRTAAIHITSNDTDENPFAINLVGSGVNPDQMTVANAIDLPSFAISPSGHAPWLWQSAITHDGIDAARSGSITDAQSSSFYLSARGPCSVSFWWRVSSEPDTDSLSFYIDGQKQGEGISGEVMWQQKIHELPAGDHVLEWRYSKDLGFSEGLDCGWVDLVTFTSPASQLQQWRQTHFGTTADAGDASNSADPDKDGVENMLEFAFGLHPLQPSAAQLPQWNRNGEGLVCSFTQPLTVSGIEYRAEWSESMAPGSWQPLSDSGVGGAHYFMLPIGGTQRKFARLRVTETNTPPAPGVGEFVEIPAGWFEMGNNYNEGWPDEKPVHSVYVSAFLMGRYEVTQVKWDLVAAWAAAHGYDIDTAYSYGPRGNHPVDSATWYDVVKWCNALSEIEGLTPCYTVGGVTYRTGTSDPDCNWTANGYRLPTEAEWEKAARGGVAGKRFPLGDTISHSQANYESSASLSYDVSPTRGYHPIYNGDSAPVGSFEPNAYGLYDMEGNESEWCWDWHGYYSPYQGADPRGPVSGEARILRGGDAFNLAIYARNSFRGSGWPNIDYGAFRLARSSAP